MYKNLILSGGIFHPFAESSRALADILEPLNVGSEIVTDIEQGLARLAQGHYDLLTVNALRWRMRAEKYAPYRRQWSFSLSAAGREALKRHLQLGRSLLGLHTASICFDDWPEWQHILGGAWQWDRSYHPPQGDIDISINGSDGIVAGAAPFTLCDEIYTDLSLQPDIEVLLVSAPHGQAPAQPLLWKHRYAAGKVIYDALGHDAASIANPAHAAILRRAVQWLLYV